MSHSTHVGFSAPPAKPASLCLALTFAQFTFGPQSLWSRLHGVGNVSALFTAVAKPSPLRALRPTLLWLPLTVGVGHRFFRATVLSEGRALLRPFGPGGLRLCPPGDAADVGKYEEPLPAVRRALLFRAEHVPFRIEPCAGQVFEYFAQSAGHVPSDVLEKSESCSASLEHSQHVRPKVARVVGSCAFTCHREGLAGISASDEIHCSTPCCSVEGFKVRPDRRWIQLLVFHARDQDRCRIGFPLHVTDGSSVGTQCKVDPADSGAETNGT